jgi:hypothetical protein
MCARTPSRFRGLGAVTAIRGRATRCSASADRHDRTDLKELQLALDSRNDARAPSAAARLSFVA